MSDPVAAGPVADPAMMAAAAVPAAAVDLGGSDRHAMLEAMVAEPRSQANPFLTRGKRIRRADFLLRTGQAWPATDVAARSDQPSVLAADRWSETRLTGKATTRMIWRPAGAR
jgi:hypothetical protein